MPLSNEKLSEHPGCIVIDDIRRLLLNPLCQVAVPVVVGGVVADFTAPVAALKSR